MFNGKRLRDLRDRRGYSQNELALQFRDRGYNVTYGTISNWEKGKTEPSFSDAVVLAKIFDVDLDLLFVDESLEKSG